MTMPASQCPWRMQVHHVIQGTPDVWMISLICHNYYPYRAGQYALVSMRNSAEALRAYITSSMPGVGEYITLAVRRVDDGVGSWWLTHDVERGNYLWFSDVMGESTCDNKAEGKFLLLAAGCGVTPIMSMRRWLAKDRPQADAQVIYNVRTPQDVIFTDEWHNYPVTPMAENNATEDFTAGRLTRELLAGIPDLASHIVMTCGPASYMDWVEQEVRVLGTTRFFKEKFFTLVTRAVTSGLKFTKPQPVRKFYAPVGATLLETLESNNVPVVTTHRAGVYSCCKTKVISGEYTVGSAMTLADAEITEDYVLACSCHPQRDLVLA